MSKENYKHLHGMHSPPQLGGGGGQGGLKMLEKSLLGVGSNIFIFVGEVILLRGDNFVGGWVT